jgi:hypothetical protein
MLETAKYILAALADGGWRSLAALVAGAPSLVLIRPGIELPDFLAQRMPEAAPAAEHRFPEEPVAAGAQWQRVAASIERTIDTAQHAVRLQSDARTQLDAAEFTLAQLMKELVDVMPLHAQPIAVTSRQPVPAFKRALAA